MSNRSLPARFILAVLAAASFSCGSTPPAAIKNAPYTINGRRYTPMSVAIARDYQETGIASWYGPTRFWHRREETANGEKVSRRSLSAAHRTLPLPSTIRVTNLENGRRLKLRVNDRGPFVDGRILDVSPRAASKLRFRDQGLARVRIEVLRVGR